MHQVHPVIRSHRKNLVERRAVMAGIAAFAAGAPRQARAQVAPKVLRVVPQADVAVTDPLYTTAWISTIHGTMVWESLFAWNSKLEPKPQMAREWSTSPDGLTWRFTLRDGLKFHDGQPVTTADVIPSLKRWMTIDAMAKKVAAVTEAMTPLERQKLRMALVETLPKPP